MLLSNSTSLFDHYVPWDTSSKHVWMLFLALIIIWKFITLDHDLMTMLASLTYPSWRLRKHYTDRVIWITGASSGLGRALALELARYPCVLVLSARREEELEKVKYECKTAGCSGVMVLPLDSLEFDRLPGLVEKVLMKYGKIDILVNNAGRSQRSLAEDTELAVDKAIMELNLFGYVAHTKAVLPTMRDKKSGTIVAISSISGKMGVPVSTAYAASKHAVHGFFDSLRMEVYSYGINVCTVCPGPVRSNIGLSSFTETVDKSFNSSTSDMGKKQSTDRFAYLMSIALAARLSESWICIQPYLLFTYIAQYFPSVFQSFLANEAAQYRIRKFKNKECLY